MKTNKFIITLLVFVLCLGCGEDNLETAPVFAPANVINLSSVAGNTQIILTWEIPDNASISELELTYSPDGGSPILIAKEETTYTVTGLTNGTEYRFTLTSKNENLRSSGTTVTIMPIEPPANAPEILSFDFMVADNPNMALEESDKANITNPVIDNDSNTVVFDSTKMSAYMYRDQLIPQFTITEGAIVTVEDVEQTSGVTPQDFTQDVVYKISKDGAESIYIITVNKDNFATIPDAELIVRLKSILGTDIFNSEDKLDITHTSVIGLTGKLNIDSQNEPVKISNLKGIEFFINTPELDFEGNDVASIDIGRMAAIKNIVASFNPLINGSINFRDRTDIEILYLGGTNITDIDVSAFPNLRRLYIHSGTPILSINVSNNTKLERLRMMESTAMNSKAYLDTMFANSTTISPTDKDFRIYKDSDGIQCTSINISTYACD